MLYIAEILLVLFDCFSCLGNSTNYSYTLMQCACAVSLTGNQILLFILGFLLFLGAALRVLSLICQMVNWMLD